MLMGSTAPDQAHKEGKGKEGKGGEGREGGGGEREGGREGPPES